MVRCHCIRQFDTVFLKSSLEKCRISEQHKKKTAWDSTNQIWGTGIPYVQIRENPRPRS